MTDLLLLGDEANVYAIRKERHRPSAKIVIGSAHGSFVIALNIPISNLKTERRSRARLNVRNNNTACLNICNNNTARSKIFPATTERV
jgi:hypothetical protein